MIAKFAALLCLIGLTHAGNLYGGSLGYASDIGYASYSAPDYAYSAPIVKTLAAAPAISYAAPAVSYSAPIVKTIAAAPAISYAAPAVSYSAPLVTKAIAAPISYSAGPAVSTVSQYSIHSSPIIKSYAAPVTSYAYSSPIVSQASYAPAVSYGSYGYGGYGNKYAW